MCRTPTPTASPTPQRVGDLPPLAALRFLPVIGLAQAGSGTSLTFGLNYTSKAAMDRPASVTLIISRSQDGQVVLTLTPNVANVAATPRPLGTPGVSVLDAGGPARDLFATADIAATDFESRLMSPGVGEQRVDEHTQPWTWSLSPKLPGDNRQATLNVQLIYRLRDDPSRNPVQGTVWSYPMSIDVREKDALVFGGVQIPTGSIGPTLIQAGISSQVPLLIAWLRTRFKHEPARPVRRKRNPPSR